jgi:hypothetical protein
VGIAYIDAGLIENLFFAFVERETHDLHLILYDRNGVVLNENYGKINAPVKEISQWNLSESQIEQILAFKPNSTYPCLNLTN